MKKLTVSLALIVSGYAANSFAALSTGNASKCFVSTPNFCGGFTFGVTGLYWRPETNHLDYALTFPAIDVSGDTVFNNGNFRQVDHDYDWGWKANIGYVFPCSGNDVNLTYTQWQHTHRDRHNRNGAVLPSTFAPFFFDDGLPVVFAGSEFTLITAPLTNPTIGSLTIALPLPAFEILIDPTDVTSIVARSRFENHTWDLDFGQSMNIGCNFRLRWFGGLRYSRLKHDFDVTTEFAGADVVTLDPVAVTVTGTVGDFSTTIGLSVTPVLNVVAALRDVACQKSDFDGIGPEFGIDATYHLGGGFGVTGRILTSLLIGETESTYAERLETAAVAAFNSDLTLVEVTAPDIIIGVSLDIASVDPAFITNAVSVANFSFRHPDETRVVPNIDAKLGLDWTYQFCNCSHSKVTIEAGYMVSHYFNAIDRLSGLELFAPEVRPRQALDVSFDGPYVGVQVNL